MGGSDGAADDVIYISITVLSTEMMIRMGDKRVGREFNYISFAQFGDIKQRVVFWCVLFDVHSLL